MDAEEMWRRKAAGCWGVEEIGWVAGRVCRREEEDAAETVKTGKTNEAGHSLMHYQHYHAY